jgi:antitoxin component YwqK of YwqJK toxin-antitoxin module
MKLKSMTLIVFGMVFKSIAFAQIPKRTYYDLAHTKVMENYSVNSKGLKNGVYIKYDERGIKAVEATFVNGALEGPGKDYYLPWVGTPNDGRIKTSGKYKNGEKDGVCVTFDYVNNGKSFNTDEELKTGKQVKKMEEYYKIGNKYRETTYFPNGIIKKDYFLQDGFFKSYFENGKPYIIGTVKGGKFDGDYISYNSIGLIVFKGTYIKGLMVGEWILPRDTRGYYPEANKEDEMIYTRKLYFKSDGSVDPSAISTSYYTDGTLRDSCYLKSIGYYGDDNIGEGFYFSYYPNGKLKEKGSYNSNRNKIGAWEFYNEDGSLKEIMKYD